MNEGLKKGQSIREESKRYQALRNSSEMNNMEEAELENKTPKML
jgi:hypothetical protein